MKTKLLLYGAYGYTPADADDQSRRGRSVDVGPADGGTYACRRHENQFPSRSAHPQGEPDPKIFRVGELCCRTSPPPAARSHGARSSGWTAACQRRTRGASLSCSRLRHRNDAARHDGRGARSILVGYSVRCGTGSHCHGSTDIACSDRCRGSHHATSSCHRRWRDTSV